MNSKYSQVEYFLSKFKEGVPYLLITLLVIVIYVGNFAFLQKLEYSIEDMIRSTKPLEPDKTNLAIVAIDQRSIKQVGKWPWDHVRFSDLLITICDYKPKAVLVDLPFTDRVREYVAGHSGELAQSIADCGNVILPIDIVVSERGRMARPAPEYLYSYSLPPGADVSSDDLPWVIAAFVPAKLFAGKARGIGFRYYEPDIDGDYRSANMLVFEK